MAKNKKVGVATGKPDTGDPLVEGIVLNLGDDLVSAKRSAALKMLLEESEALSKFAAAYGNPSAKPFGKGSPDLMLRFAGSSRIPVEKAWELVHQLREHRLVADAEPAVSFDAQVQPPGMTISSIGDDKHLCESDPQTWSLAAAGVQRAWSASTARGAGILIGHPDTGYTDHQELVEGDLRVELGYNFEDERKDPRDSLKNSSVKFDAPGHGAATASVIMSPKHPADPSKAVVGSAPDAALVPLRVSDSVLHFSFANLARALYWARDTDCHLVSMSLGGPWAGRALGRAVDQVIDDGLILLSAAGNVWPWVVFPAKFDRVIAVAATNALDKPWKKSAKGSAVDVSAPGESVWRARSMLVDKKPVFDIARSSGTSYAVATTAGICALWMSHHGAKNLRKRYGGRLAAVFHHVLKTSGVRTPKGWDTSEYGTGIVDAEKLLAAPLPELPPAGAVRASILSVDRGSQAMAWSRLQFYFPELSPDELARAVLPMFGKKSVVAALRIADVIDEVEFHVATNPEVRASVLAAATRKQGGASMLSVRKSKTGPVTKTLRSVGSKRLRSMTAA